MLNAYLIEERILSKDTNFFLPSEMLGKEPRSWYKRHRALRASICDSKKFKFVDGDISYLSEVIFLLHK